MHAFNFSQDLVVLVGDEQAIFAIERNTRCVNGDGAFIEGRQRNGANQQLLTSKHIAENKIEYRFRVDLVLILLEGGIDDERTRDERVEFPHRVQISEALRK